MALMAVSMSCRPLIIITTVSGVCLSTLERVQFRSARSFYVGQNQIEWAFMEERQPFLRRLGARTLMVVFQDINEQAGDFRLSSMISMRDWMRLFWTSRLVSGGAVRCPVVVELIAAKRELAGHLARAFLLVRGNS
jgi:hypothetical protein